MLLSGVDLKGKVALVTGSARRVGKSIALGLAHQGMSVVVHHSRSDQEAQETLNEIVALGCNSLVVKADLRSALEIDQLFVQIREHFGRLDVLVNSASSYESGNIAELSLTEWEEVMALNVTAPFLCSQEAARLMGVDGGSIVNILDMDALFPSRRHPHHSVSKMALKGLTEVLALNLAPRIRVNAVAAGPVLRDSGHNAEEWFLIGERLPLKRTGTPEDVARAVIYLVQEGFLTGVTLPVSGGDHLR